MCIRDSGCPDHDFHGRADGEEHELPAGICGTLRLGCPAAVSYTHLDVYKRHALFTGVRIGELCGLQMKDISLTDKTISINKTVQRIYDKKKGESYLHIGPPKTKTSARTIPVPSLLMNIIKKFYTENPNHYFLTGKTKPTEPRTYRQFFSRFLKRHGLQKVKFHEIRHTFAVRAIEIPEFDVKSLSEILGHKNVSFTLNVYGSANLQQKVKCMNLLNDLL